MFNLPLFVYCTDFLYIVKYCGVKLTQDSAKTNNETFEWNVAKNKIKYQITLQLGTIQITKTIHTPIRNCLLFMHNKSITFEGDSDKVEMISEQFSQIDFFIVQIISVSVRFYRLMILISMTEKVVCKLWGVIYNCQYFPHLRFEI